MQLLRTSHSQTFMLFPEISTGRTSGSSFVIAEKKEGIPI